MPHETAEKTAQRIAHNYAAGQKADDMAAAIHQAILSHCNAEVNRKKLITEAQHDIGEWAKKRWPEKWNARGRGQILLEEAAEASVASKDEERLLAELRNPYALTHMEIGDCAVALDALGHLTGISVLEAKAEAFERAKRKHGEEGPK